jgi:2-phosphosulfolactate phosphatase
VTLVRVALVPTAMHPDPTGLCAVVDVIRASTTLTTIAAAHDSKIYVASNIQTARTAAESIGQQAVLAGERGGVAPAGFSYGNSPLESVNADLTNRTIVLSTTNGTHAIELWASSRRTFIGCLRNAGAVASQLLGEPTTTSITIVCAGRAGELAIDDVYTAGAIVSHIVDAGAEVTLDETALTALHVNHAYQDSEQALSTSRSAQLLKPVGHFDDVAFCAEQDVSIVVPEVGHEGRIHIWPDSDIDSS